MDRMRDEARRALGFMTAWETAALAARGIVMPEPDAVLISPGVELAAGVILWPGTVLLVTAGRLALGPGTQCFPGTRLAAEGGTVIVAGGTEIGDEGGFTIRADADAVIAIGEGARLLGGGSLSGTSRIGAGAQILGAIRCRECVLEEGGSHREPDPGLRGGVLKGLGIARGLVIPRGHVIQAFGDFADAPLRHQTYFHPPPAGG